MTEPHYLRVNLIYFTEISVDAEETKKTFSQEETDFKDLESFLTVDDSKVFETIRGYFENIHLVVDDEFFKAADKKGHFSIEDFLDSEREDFLMMIEQFFRSYPDYSIKLMMPQSSHDMVVFSKNVYQQSDSTAEQNKGTFSVNLYKSVEKDYPVMVSGLEQEFLNKFSEQVLRKGRFKLKTFDDGTTKSKHYCLDLSIEDSQELTKWLFSNPSLGTIFDNKKTLIDRRPSKDCAWDLYVFDQVGEPMFVSNYYVNGKKTTSPNFSDILVPEAKSYDYLAYMTSGLTAYSKGFYELRHIRLPNMLILFDSANVRDRFNLQFVLKTGIKEGNNLIPSMKGFEREFLTDLKDRFHKLIIDADYLGLRDELIKQKTSEHELKVRDIKKEQDKEKALITLPELLKSKPLQFVEADAPLNNPPKIIIPDMAKINEHVANLSNDLVVNNLDKKAKVFYKELSYLADRLVGRYFL